MTFEQLEKTIAKWMLLEDTYVVKLLCATVIANRIPKFKPTWLFLVSNSSGGKSELLSALSCAENMWEQDNLTSKTLISGAKRGAAETSLIYRMPAGSIMVMKDLTLLLDKDPKEASQIFSQLRLLYDGKLYASYGTGEDVRAVVRLGLIAGVTSAIEDVGAKQATMGMRTIKYYMKQPDRMAVTRMSLRDDDETDDENQMQVEMGAAFKNYLDNIKIPEQIPRLPDNITEDIVMLSEMSTAARSSIKRKEYSRDNQIERKDLKEMPIRMAKQLKNIGRSLMIMNQADNIDGLTGKDARMIYQIALDSIPSVRKEIMEEATHASTVTLDGLASKMKLDVESVKLHADDLVALDIMSRSRGINNKYVYELKYEYRELIHKFEGIEMTDKLLDSAEDIPPEFQPTENLPVETIQSIFN